MGDSNSGVRRVVGAADGTSRCVADQYPFIGAFMIYKPNYEIRLGFHS